MEAVVIALIATAVLVASGVRVNARYRAHQRLPMQWSLSGEVTWSAPRRLALAFVPALGIVTLVAVTPCRSDGGIAADDPTRRAEWAAVPAVLLVALGLLACQRFHVWSVARTVDPSSG